MTDRDAAQLTGVPVIAYRKLLAELEDKGVPSRTTDGVLYSRRMDRDGKTRDARAAGGPLGAEHGQKGAAHGKKGGRPRKFKGGSDGGLSNPPPVSVVVSVPVNRWVASQPVGLSPDVAPPNGHDHKPKGGRGLADDARQILEFLNEKAHKNFPESDSNVGIVVARLREGFPADKVRQVVAMKVRQWGADEKMREFLRPATLFARSNFSNYVGELVDPTIHAGGESST